MTARTKAGEGTHVERDVVIDVHSSCNKQRIEFRSDILSSCLNKRSEMHCCIQYVICRVQLIIDAPHKAKDADQPSATSDCSLKRI